MKKLIALIAATVALHFYLNRPPPPSPCADVYRQLLGAKPDLDVTVVFGYKDARPARFVGDRYERALLIQQLMKAGFRRTPADDDLLTRAFQDPDGKARTLRLRVVNSAAGADDRENRLDPYQSQRTADAQTAFLSGLERADVVLYNGHARVGGGPDFAPPKLARDEHVDYNWYKKNQPGLASMRTAFERAGGAKLVGLFACDANTHFAKMLAHRPAIVADELIYFADSLRVTFETIQNLVALKCEPDFNPSGTRTTRFFSSKSN